jgi:enterochelin esterase-like enzyme
MLTVHQAKGGSDPLIPYDPETADLRLLWISCGVSDRLVFERNNRLIAQLKKDDLPVTVAFTNGGHDWPVWRNNFKQFVSQLFQPK